MSEYILEMRDITKEFPGVKALDNVNLKVKKGEIHTLVGENGAGKSTLMNVLSGVYPYGTYSGEILFEGKECRFHSIAQSEKIGIAIIHQELMLIPLLSIAENIYLGNEINKRGFMDWNAEEANTIRLLKEVGLNESPKTLITDLSVGKQQLVEIAKALSKECKLLILDEPTSSLNESDSDNLLELLQQLKKRGITSIMISHKLSEVNKIADSITIIRDGSTIETLVKGVDDISEDRIIKGMVGRDMTNRYPSRDKHIGETFFEVKDWTVYHPMHEGRKVCDDINISIKRGEIVGLAGLMGAGRTELAMSIFGRSYGRNIEGTIIKDGQKVDISTIQKSIRNGVAYATEDRKGLGLVLIQDVAKNITLANISDVTENGFINQYKEINAATEYRTNLNIKCSNIFQQAINLSGGNQQKVVISKWLFANPDLLILDEPTRGIDVGAKYEIYTIVNKLANEGKGILLISSELPELLGVADRIYVMNEGKIVGEMDAADASQEKIMNCIMKTAEVKA